MIKLPEPAKRPTMYFVGVTTGQSSIMKVFPVWAKALGLDAEIKGIDKSGYRVIVNTGNDAQQTVHHVHVHVLGGAPMNSGSPAL